MDMDVKEPRGIIQNRYFAKRIVIIGAGVSGLSAASELQKLGFENVVVLEARNTTGGRVQTVHFGSDFVEIGAEWLHGHEGNRMYEIARDHDLIEEDRPDYLEALLMKWSNVADKEQREAISSTVTMLEKAMDKMNGCEPSALPKSLKEYLSNNFESYLLSCSDSHLIKLIKQAAYDWFVKLQFELNGCRSLSDVSCKLLLNFKECEGCQVTELKSGYSSVLNVLCKNIPESWIKKNREVKTVVWKNVSGGTSELDEKMGELQLSNSDEVKSHAVSIHCVNGEVYVADHVIVTIPLGYLKKSHDSLFIPPLPSDKVNAIQCIGFHALNKIFLEFEEPFWEKPSVFNMLWINEDFQSLVDNGSFHQCLEASWHKFISRFAYVSHHPRMLCAWIVGDGAVIMEGLPEKQVLKECHELLQQQLGRIDIPFPCRIIRSKWGTDPYTHGSYSYLSVNCEEAGVTNEELASPITREFDSSPLLQFAGEATHSSFYSTVHGAYESGIREAQRIFNYYRHCNGKEKD